MKFIRRAAEIIGYITIGAFVLVLVGLYLTSENRAAQKLGFDDAADQKAAVAAGQSDPKTWQARKAELKAEQDAADARRVEEARAAAQTAIDEQRKRQEAEAVEQTKRQAEEAKAAAARKVEEEREAKKKEAECRSDLRCWAEKGTVAASVYCKDRISKLAQYDMKWTDSWYETKFSHFKWSRTAPKDMGVVTYLGDKAQFQNGFGAFQNVIYSCDMIPGDQNHTIFDVSVTPGRLD